MTQDEKQTALTIDYKFIFDTPQGKNVLEDLSRFCLEKYDIFVVDSARKTDFNLGANSVIRYIRSRINKNLMDSNKKETIS